MSKDRKLWSLTNTVIRTPEGSEDDGWESTLLSDLTKYRLTLKCKIVRFL